MQKTTIPIQGMHCRSCEIILSDAILGIPNISKVIANYKKKEADIYSKEEIPLDKISQAVESAGYKIGIDEKRPFFTQDSKKYKEFIAAFLIAFVLYEIAKRIGLFELNLIPEGNAGNPVITLLVGVTAGFSTCMALVGGLILGISASHAEKHPEASPLQKFRPHLYFNLGRIIGYFILGGIIGLAGKALQLSNSSLGILTLIVGFIMLLMGLQLTELFPKISKFSLSLPSKIGSFFGIKSKQEKEYSHVNSMIVGGLTFFLPCGFTQAMQIYAMSTGSFLAGAVVMGTFALGTAPGLIGLGGLSSIFKGKAGRIFFKFAGIVVIAFAILNISNGYNLVKINAARVGTNNNNQTYNRNISQSNNNSQTQGVTIENGVQVVKMIQKFNGYFPDKFTIKKGVPVRWKIYSETSYTCASSIFMPDMNIDQNLNQGENVIEFTPKETGTLYFMCGMGMFRGEFEVIN